VATKKTQESEVSILEVSRGVIDICLLGESPMICNAMSQKVRHELLLPKGKKTAADKVFPEPDSPTRATRSPTPTSKSKFLTANFSRRPDPNEIERLS
jgi:hypothetical protein